MRRLPSVSPATSPEKTRKRSVDSGRVLRVGLGTGRVIEIQRGRILAAMVEVSAERGSAGVTVAHVVQCAGVSRRTFYEIFNDCEGCFLAAFDEAVNRATRHLREAADPNAKWTERTRTALLALLEFLDAEPDTARLLIAGSLGAGDNALERRQRLMARLILEIDEGRKEMKAGSELPPLTANGLVGGILSVLHSKLVEGDTKKFVELAGPLMAMIALPYLGPAAARKELARPVPQLPTSPPNAAGNPLGQLEMRLTYRTVRVLMAVAAHPGSSNRVVADVSGIGDQGQMSKMLTRLHSLGLIENTGGGSSRGEPNAWTLTDKGWRVQGAFAERAEHS